MRSYDENYGFLPEDKSGRIELPLGMSSHEIEQWARHQRAMILGEHLAAAIVWVCRLPGKLIAALRRRDMAPRAGAARNA